ncbi:MAG: hypothetical protein GC190_11400 [Alphaproteobacteria bacterium]|nr:hypothetical protein [Alphaproteobacteria bacterium]
MARAFAIFGAVGFFFWGGLHIAAAQQVYHLGLSLDAGVAQGRIFQDAFYLLAFAVLTMLSAVGWVWRNDARATWFTIVVTAIADVPFVVFLVAPGIVGPPISILGPGLWLVASISCLVALTLQRPRSS